MSAIWPINYLMTGHTIPNAYRPHMVPIAVARDVGWWRVESESPKCTPLKKWRERFMKP